MNDRTVPPDAARRAPPSALESLSARLPVEGLTLVDEAALNAFGGDLQRALAIDCARAPVRVSLVGDLGAGKSTLARAVLRAFGHSGAVRSPTYTLIERYDVAGLAIAHVDLYRLADPLELEAIGFDELVTECDLLMVEWASRGDPAMPPFTAAVRLAATAEQERHLRLDVRPSGTTLQGATGES